MKCFPETATTQDIARMMADAAEESAGIARAISEVADIAREISSGAGKHSANPDKEPSVIADSSPST